MNATETRTPEPRTSSLGRRFFLAAALLVASTVAVAILVTVFVGNRISGQAVSRALERSGKVQESLRDRSLEQLRLATRMLADDPAFAAYTAEAIESGDDFSILDQLDERQRDLGYEFAIVLDADGALVARTDVFSSMRSEELDGEPLVTRALEEYEAAGVWARDGALYEAAVAPVGNAGLLAGFLIAGLSLDDAAALELRRVSGTEVSFVAPTEDGPTLAVSTLDAGLADELESELRTRTDFFAGLSDDAEPRTLKLGQRRWYALELPLSGADGEPTGAVVCLASLDEQVAPFRQIRNTLFGVGLVAVLAALAISYMLPRKILAPLHQLAGAARSAARGDYDQVIETDQNDEVGDLAEAFSTLLSELREKRDMEVYIGELLRSVEAEDEAAVTHTAIRSMSSPFPSMSPDDERAPTVSLPSGAFNPPAAGIPAPPPGRLPPDPFPEISPDNLPEELPTLTAVMPGTQLGGRFLILSELGAGGMGVVYKARDNSLEELVALKMLKNEVWDDQERLAGLKSELKLARKIAHPNVLRTYDFGELDGVPFISMEFVRGITLRGLLDRSGRLPLSAGLRLARQLCRGLEAAHTQAVIHRDIKPENLILEHTGNVKLMDFGIAQRKAHRPSGEEAGSLVGTPHYLAPEQIQGHVADARSDIYASGVVFYEVFTGALPFPKKGNLMQILHRKIEQDATPAREHWPEIPEGLERVLMRCLARDPAQRHPDVGALLDDLEQLRG